MSFVKPSEEEATSYYKRIIGDLPLEVKYLGENKGYGLFATEDIKKKNILFTELPAISIQHPENKRRSYNCAGCFKHLGSLAHQLQHLVGRTFNVPNSLPAISDEASQLTPLVSCEKCGEMYCSEECREDVYLPYHRMFCHLSKSDDPQDKKIREKILKFEKHAVSSGTETYIMAAKVIVSVILASPLLNVTSKLNKDHKDTFNPMELAFEPFKHFHGKPWWEVADMSEYEEEGATEQEKKDAGNSLNALKESSVKQLKEELTQSSTILREILELRLEQLYDLVEKLVPEEYFASHKNKITETMDQMLSLDFYANMLGTFNLNNVSIEILSPLRDYFETIDQLDPKSKRTAIKILAPIVQQVQKRHDPDHKNKEEKTEEDEEEAEDSSSDEENVHSFSWPLLDKPSKKKKGGKTEENSDELSFTTLLFPSFHGTGIFPLLAKLNHSCSPNTSIEFTETKKAHLYVIKDIKPGEEVCISYIDDSMEYDDRQFNLRTYGFSCSCERCESEKENYNK